VYALYGKIYYPAVVLARADINAYDVKFVVDKVEKKCPRGSIIPLVALDEGKTVN
jgi:hypothetical protein